MPRRARRKSPRGSAPEDQPDPAGRFVDRLEACFALQSRYGFGPPTVDRDRAEFLIQWVGPRVSLNASFYSAETEFSNVGLSVVPTQRVQAFSLSDALAVLDPEQHQRAPDTAGGLTFEQLGRWLEHYAAFFHAHAHGLLEEPASVFARVRAAAPLGEQCQGFVTLCRELWGLERDLGYDPPEVVHWRHECELNFRKGPLRLEVTLEDHENAGVAEPLTVPVAVLYNDAAGLALPLATAMEALDPGHYQARPVATRYAMRLQALRPFLEHTATFIAQHPEVLTTGAVLAELGQHRDA